MNRLICLGLLFVANQATAFDQSLEKRIPDEYESTGGHGLAFGDAGVAAVGGIASVRTNPAMLAAEKEYRVHGGYHWPTEGRNFFQAGVVDSKTSNYAAGVSYTGFVDEYRYFDGVSSASPIDSPVVRRGAVGLAQNLGPVAVGLGGHYVEANTLRSTDAWLKDNKERVKGVGLTAGVAGLLTPALRFGFAGENLSNKTIADYAPRTYRGGVAYMSGGGDVTTHLDYRHRDRVAHFEAKKPEYFNDLGQVVTDTSPDLMKKPEQMVIGSFTARFADAFRLIGAYGHSLTDDRRSLSGGLGLVGPQFSLSYTASRPYMKETVAHQAINLAVEMSM